jgi:hypothetical protein
MSTYTRKSKPLSPIAKKIKQAAMYDADSGSMITYKDMKGVDGKRTALAALNAYEGFAEGSRTTWRDVTSNVSVRDSFNRSDYEYFRPEESIPQKSREIIQSCMEAYRRVGLVRNVIDLMGDFGAQGIRLNHPNPQIQSFYRKWFNKVNGVERSERFLNLLYRCANVPIKRKMATLPQSAFNNKTKALGVDITSDGPLEDGQKTQRGVIPIKYTFLNPLNLTPINPELSNFIGKLTYGIKLPYKLVSLIKNPKTLLDKQLVGSLPKDIVEAAKSEHRLLPLDNTKLSIYFYKKDDWQVWADPMIFAILSSLIVLEKMQMADLAALDGVISQIRIWKLGHLNDTNPGNSIFPTEPVIRKLSDILMSNPGGGAFDIIWGPDLEVKDYTTNAHEFLGGEKYEPVLNSIYAGLGVPPTLTGAATSSGFTNNYISLKTLVQRLEYGRSLLRDFWQNEIELVRQAMGFRTGATVSFDRMILTDEAAEKALVLQMVDRNLMSIEAAQERIGEDPDLEKLRLIREEQERVDGTAVDKAGPWFDPEKTYNLIKIALQKGLVTPKQSGIDIEEDFDEPPFMTSLKNTSTTDNKDGGGVSGQGRPKNSKDKDKRAQRKPKVRTSADNIEVDHNDTAWFMTKMTWAKQAYKLIEDIINPGVLHIYKKKNARMLSTAESKLAENMKFSILTRLPLFSNIDVKTVYSLFRDNKLSLAKQYEEMYKRLFDASSEELDRSLTIEESRSLQIASYCMLKE